MASDFSSHGTDAKEHSPRRARRTRRMKFVQATASVTSRVQRRASGLRLSRLLAGRRQVHRKGTRSQGDPRGAVANLYEPGGSEDRIPNRFALLRALRVLRGETVLYLCESLGASLSLYVPTRNDKEPIVFYSVFEGLRSRCSSPFGRQRRITSNSTPMMITRSEAA